MIPFIFCLLSFAGAFFSGRRILQAIGSWYVTINSNWLFIKSFISISVSFLAIILAKILLRSFQFLIAFRFLYVLF